MNSRERVMKALNHQEPDRVPINCLVTIDVYEDLERELGFKHVPPSHVGNMTDVQMPIEMIKALGIDMYYISRRAGRTSHNRSFDDGSYIDEWGILWKKVILPNGQYYFEIGNAALANAEIDDLDKYIWPDPDDPLRYEGLYEEMKHVHHNTELAIVAKFASHVFEYAKYLRGMEQFLTDLLINKEFALKLLEKLTSIQKRINENCFKLAGKYVDVYHLSGEDFGMQTGPMISPQTFKDVLKPSFKELSMHAKTLMLKENPKAKMMFHSCGSVYQLIEDFIDCGVDVLDPVQPRAAEMDRFRLKEVFGDRLSFHGALDTQYALPFGSEEELEEEVKTAIEALGPGGGYILGPSNYVQSDVGAVKMLKIIEYARKYGTYPLSK